MHALARLIEDVMAAHEWKPADVARRTSISTSRISQLRTKPLKGVPDKKTILSLARGLGVPPWVVMDAILESLGLPTRPTHISIEEAIRADASLSADSKYGIVAFAQHVRDQQSPRPDLSRVEGLRLAEEEITAEDQADSRTSH